MTFTNDGTCVEKMKSSDEVISAVLTKSRQAQKYMRKLGKVTEAVAAYRLREMKNLQAVENLADYHHPQGNVFFCTNTLCKQHSNSMLKRYLARNTARPPLFNHLY